MLFQTLQLNVQLFSFTFQDVIPDCLTEKTALVDKPDSLQIGSLILSIKPVPGG